MRRADILAVAWWGARSRPLRTLALLLSLGAGVAAAVFVGTVISGFGREIDRLAFGAYTRALVVHENVLVVDRHRPPNLGDLERLNAGLEPLATTAAWKTGLAQAYAPGETVVFTVYGVTGDYELELDSPLASGRMLTPEEVSGFDRVCVVGAETAFQLKRQDLVGSRLRIEGVDCEIVGVLGEPRSRPAARFAESVIAPFRAAERYFIRDTPLGPGEADSLTLFMKPDVDMASAEMQTDLLLRKHRGAPLSRASPFSYGLPSASVEQIREQRDMLTRLLGGLATLSILTSLVAFGAISAAAIASRQREIALRMAMGASGADIQVQIVTETLIVGVLGGGLGLAGGLALAWAASAAWAWPFAPNAPVAGLALLLGGGTGLTIGAILARQAAALPPSLAARG